MSASGRDYKVAIARRAAEIIQERGKATGEMRDHLGRVCALGALRAAKDEIDRTVQPLRRSPADWRMCSIRAQIRELIHEQNAPGYHDITGQDITTWSDDPRTTEQDIAKVFLQVADRIEVSE